MTRRLDRINVLLRQEISQLLARQIKDPRLDGVVSITQVKTANDLRSARVFLSVLGDRETQEEALAGIRSAATYLRRELRGRVTLRYVPFLSFELDDSIEGGARVLQLMDGLREDRGAGDESSGAATPAYEGPLSFPGDGG